MLRMWGMMIPRTSLHIDQTMGLKSFYNFYGRGKPLRWAIAFTCQLAFVLFGVSLPH